MSIGDLIATDYKSPLTEMSIGDLIATYYKSPLTEMSIGDLYLRIINPLTERSIDK